MTWLLSAAWVVVGAAVWLWDRRRKRLRAEAAARLAAIEASAVTYLLAPDPFDPATVAAFRRATVEAEIRNAFLARAGRSLTRACA